MMAWFCHSNVGYPGYLYTFILNFRGVVETSCILPKSTLPNRMPSQATDERQPDLWHIPCWQEIPSIKSPRLNLYPLSTIPSSFTRIKICRHIQTSSTHAMHIQVFLRCTASRFHIPRPCCAVPRNTSHLLQPCSREYFPMLSILDPRVNFDHSRLGCFCCARGGYVSCALVLEIAPSGASNMNVCRLSKAHL